MLDHAFRFVESVVFLMGPTNIRSQKAMEKIGGVMIEPREKTIRGKTLIQVVYQIKKPNIAPTIEGPSFALDVTMRATCPSK